MSIKKGAILHLHGQGSNKKHSSDDMFDGIKDYLEDYEDYYFKAIEYISPLQKNQSILNKKLDESDCSFMCIRSKLVSSFGDPATIYQDKSEYERVTNIIKSAILTAKEKIEDGAPIFIVAHSLGTIMISNYLWDMQKVGLMDKQIAGVYTTGSPLHIFLSGKRYSDIKAIEPTSDDFEWINFWNPKDVLSSPYRILSPSYNNLVTDIKIKRGWFLESHGKYDETRKVFKEISSSIERLTF